jgi:two-component system CheB/CheR fusion protein
VLHTPEDNANRAFANELKMTLENGRVEEDRWHVRKDGSRVFCSGITFPLSDGELRGYVKIARDLTGSRQSQNQATPAWDGKGRNGSRRRRGRGRGMNSSRCCRTNSSSL